MDRDPSLPTRSSTEQFGAIAEEYVRSSVHAAGADLTLLADWAEGGPGTTLLDVATGGGHTALALSRFYAHVVALDLTAEMLDAARKFTTASGARNVEFVLGDATQLPFADECFEAVSCRIAAHHFPDLDRFVAECGRVLKPSGLLLFEDNVVPEPHDLAEGLNRVEKLRDPSHRRSLTKSQWVELIKSHNFSVEAEAIDRKPHNMIEWLDRSRTPHEAREQVLATLRSLGQRGVDAFLLTHGPNGEISGFTDEKVLVKARKPAEAAT